MQVRLVQKLDSGKIYAMKSLKKAEMFKKDQASWPLRHSHSPASLRSACPTHSADQRSPITTHIPLAE